MQRLGLNYAQHRGPLRLTTLSPPSPLVPPHHSSHPYSSHPPLTPPHLILSNQVAADPVMDLLKNSTDYLAKLWQKSHEPQPHP